MFLVVTYTLTLA
jgi:hypothetical protein